MKILLVHQYFRTPEEGFGIRSHYLARSFLQRGHQVTILTAHNVHKGRHLLNGLEVCYFRIPYGNQFGFARRLLAFFRYVLKARRHLRQHHDFDLAYVITTPLSTGLIALYGKKRYKIPYVFEVGDLWPKIPIELGMIRNVVLQRLLYRFEKRVYENAQQLVGLSEPIVAYMRKIHPNGQIHLAPNMADCSFFSSAHKSEAQFNAEKPLQICYTGTFGYANELGLVLDLARTCLDTDLPIMFNLMGDGREKNTISYKSQNLPNVNLCSHGGMSAVRDLMNKCDATIISFRNSPSLHTGSPNKLFDGLASGHLIIVNYGGWVADLIESCECGFSYMYDHNIFVERIREFLDNPTKLLHFQKNSRQLAQQRFEVSLVTSRLTSDLEL